MFDLSAVETDALLTELEGRCSAFALAMELRPPRPVPGHPNATAVVYRQHGRSMSVTGLLWHMLQSMRDEAVVSRARGASTFDGAMDAARRQADEQRRQAEAENKGEGDEDEDDTSRRGSGE